MPFLNNPFAHKIGGLLLLSCFGSMLSHAQAKPSFTQYVLNNYVLNPAVSGIENYTDVKISNRNQWVGINGAPVSTYFSVHAPLNKSDLRTSATSFQVPGENPRGEQYWEQYTAPEPHHGVGMIAMNDKAGYINRWSVSASYAYHQPLGLRTTLSAGFNAGITSINIDRSKIDFASLDPNDPAIGFANGDLRKVKPEVGAGLWLYSRDYFVGLAVQNIVPSRVSFAANNNYAVNYSPNYFFTGGYRFLLNDDFNFIPSVMLQYWKPQLLGGHANAKLQYRDLLWMGASYRYGDLISGYSGMAGVNIGNSVNISYAYEVATTNRLRAYTGNTHEIQVGFIIGNKYGDTCPRNIW